MCSVEHMMNSFNHYCRSADKRQVRCAYNLLTNVNLTVTVLTGDNVSQHTFTTNNLDPHCRPTLIYLINTSLWSFSRHAKGCPLFPIGSSSGRPGSVDTNVKCISYVEMLSIEGLFLFITSSINKITSKYSNIVEKWHVRMKVAANSVR